MGDLKSIWTDHHALIMPSRSEGLPLTIIEAMSLGRPVITTNAGGNKEIIQHGVTGFIGEANELDFEKTMDEAWATRKEWPSIGSKAAQYIADTIPECPERLFADVLMNSI
jgi:glycosyltransferase involved in cell wall biosynthesis